MGILGSVSQLYMFILLVLLFMGSGFAIWSFINFLTERNTKKSGTGEKPKPINVREKTFQNNKEDGKVKGGFIMANNGWLKLGVVSFVGIIISVAILGLISTSSAQTMNMNGQMNMSGQSMSTQSTDIHQQHVQQGLHGSTYVQNGMNTDTSMGNMQMQGMTNGNTQMSPNSNMQYDYSMIQQQLNQMQMQLNQMQQQMGTMNGGMNGSTQMQQSGMGMMNGMGMMGGMSNMQQQNNMNQMQQQNNMQQNSSSGMSMM